MASGAAKNKNVAMLFSCRNDVQSITNSDKQCTEVRLCQHDICRSWSSLKEEYRQKQYFNIWCISAS